MKPAKVPNDVQREDQILPFVTLKQMIILLIGFAISYFLFTSLSKTHDLDELTLTLVWTPAGIAVLFAYFRVKGMSMLQFGLLILEQFIRNPRHRHWVQNGGSPLVSMTTSVTLPEDEKKRKTEMLPAKVVQVEKIKNIASLIDQN